MRQTLKLLTGLGLGASLMYWFDPQSGRRRRALSRDRLNSAVNHFTCGLDKAYRDIRHRACGLTSAVSSYFSPRSSSSDAVLLERVRSKLGRYVSHPASLQTDVCAGCVSLSGPILASEVPGLLAAVAAVRGVTTVENRLDVHPQAGSISGLQGQGQCSASATMNILQDRWTPATRLIAGTLGGGLMANCLARRTPGSIALGTLGFGLTLRSLINQPWSDFLGFNRDAKGVEFRKTITIHASPDAVFSTFAHPGNFPRFMRNIREVRDLGQGRTRWTALGPSGIPVTWEACITQLEQNKVLAWQSQPGSRIQTSGVLRFQPDEQGKTRVTIQLNYLPPGGMLGHFASCLLGADPKSMMDEDLVRLKGLLEEGVTSAPHKGVVTKQDFANLAQTRPRQARRTQVVANIPIT
jgi:uncharacterized membrane protein